MIVLVWIILAHILGSFYLQRQSRVQDQQQSSRLVTTCLYALIMAAVLVALIGLGQLGWSWSVLIAWVALSVAGYLISMIQARSATAFLVKQLINLLILVAVWAWLIGFIPFVLAWAHGVLVQRNLLIVVILYLLAARPASLFVAAVLHRQAQALQAQSQEHSSGLVEAGRMIGYVERWLVLSFVLGGQFAGIGFLLAAKSIFRFGDLSQAHERKLTEYMLLGTLVSFACAIVLGALGLYLVG